MLPYQGHESSTSQADKSSRWLSCSDLFFFGSCRIAGSLAGVRWEMGVHDDKMVQKKLLL